MSNRLFDDYTLIIQGPISNSEYEILNNIKEIKFKFPNLKVIVSTWDNSLLLDEISNIVDILIINPDPGGYNFPYFEGMMNINRQVISTASALNKTSTNFVIKMRTDCNLNIHNLYRYILKNQLNITTKVTTIEYFTRDPLKSNYLMHFSDIFLIAKTDELKKMFNLNFLNKTDVFNYTGKGLKSIITMPEQILTINYYNNICRRNIIISNCQSFKYKVFKGTVHLLFDRFNIVSHNTLGLRIPARMIIENKTDLITERCFINYRDYYKKFKILFIYYFFILILLKRAKNYIC